MKVRSLRYEALEIFKTFNQQEFTDFEHFLDVGQYLNTLGGKLSFGKSTERKRLSNKLKQFFRLVKPFYPDFKDLSNAYLLKRMKTGSISNIKKYFAKLKMLCDHFLVLKEISTNKYYYDDALLFQYQKRDLETSFDQKYKSVLKEINSSSEYHVKDFLMRYNAGVLYFNRIAPHVKMRSNTELLGVINLQEGPWFDFLFYFMLDSIRVILNFIGHANSFAINLEDIEMYRIFKQCFPDETLKSIFAMAIRRTTGKTAKKAIELHRLQYLFRTTDSKEAGVYFTKYVNILEEISNRLSLEERFDFYHERHFAFWIAMKYPEFEDIEFKMYDLYLKHEGYKTTGKDMLELLELKNLIVRGDNTFRYEWTTNVIKKYLPKLDPQFQDILLHYRNAYVYFHKEKKFEQALEELRLIEKRSHYSVTREILHLQILVFYELGYYDSCLNSLDSLRKYLINQQLSTASAEPFKKFITCMHILINNVMNKKTNCEGILQIIRENKIVASKLWLKEKVSELEHKFQPSYRRTSSL